MKRKSAQAHTFGWQPGSKVSIQRLYISADLRKPTRETNRFNICLTSANIPLFTGLSRVRVRQVRNKGMFLFSHRYLRSTVLGLMLFLAGTAFCSCDSYDPNPYDDIPPLVTVEFSYVVPGQISNATVRTAFRSGGQHALSYAEIWQMRSVVSPDLGHEQIVSMVLPTPEMFVPLRR